jgi:pyruvate/2-oxoglutarate dehydrogenase complex dihydrolipoamide acyltransferase (E2) component
MARYVFCLPDLGEGLLDGRLDAWLVDPGEPVDLNDPIAEVETVKASVELPSPVAGVVLELHCEPGDMVGVGAPLVTFEVAGEQQLVGAVPAERDAGRRVRLQPPSATGDDPDRPPRPAPPDVLVGESAGRR